MAPVLKTGNRETDSGVRIPLPPQLQGRFANRMVVVRSGCGPEHIVGALFLSRLKLDRMKSCVTSNKVSRPYGVLHTHNRGTANEYKTGVYVHPKGIAQIYIEPGYVEIAFVADGEMKIKRINTTYPVTDRSAFIYAGKFIKSIT